VGKSLSDIERQAILGWCQTFRAEPIDLSESELTVANIINAFKPWLLKYAAAGQIASATVRPFKETDLLRRQLFPVRVKIEKAIARELRPLLHADPGQLGKLYRYRFFGKSKKQGVSLRMALMTCEPTSICGARCYAHDALDATPAAVVRGVLNTVLVEMWCHNPKNELLADFIDNEILSAANAAHREAAASDFKREPRVRLSHVGEVAAYPEFANHVARLLGSHLKGPVKCVVYTRHSNARRLDAALIVINFSLDDSSREKIHSIGPRIRYVSSSFDGLLMKDVSVNFLEHHNRAHSKPTGEGHICPATAELNERSCDGVKCDLCFKNIR